MRNRPDSGSVPRRPGPDAHGAAGLNSAAAAVTISGLGNHSPNASTARSSPVSIPSSRGPRTFSAHITSPPSKAGERPDASAGVRPTTVALAPCGLAASGARDLPSTEAPALPCRNDACDDADVEPCAEGVGSVTDGVMLGIGVPAPRNLRGCPQRMRQRGSSWTGVQAPCPVYVRSPDRLNTSAQLNAAHTTHRRR